MHIFNSYITQRLGEILEYVFYYIEEKNFLDTAQKIDFFFLWENKTVNIIRSKFKNLI